MPKQPTEQEVLHAINTILLSIGENPNREGLQNTPKRMIKSWKEFFQGYNTNPETLLKTTFKQTSGYHDMVLLKDITLESYCEHHFVPIIGKAHVAYIPEQRIVGISKLARVVDAYAKRLQIQESLTVQIADCIETTLKPKGVAVIIEANHQCIATRGIHKQNCLMVTSHMHGLFRHDARTRAELMQLIKTTS